MSTKNKKVKRSNRRWTEEEIKRLKIMASQNISTKEIARRLGRTVNAVYQKAHSLGISLKPKDT